MFLTGSPSGNDIINRLEIKRLEFGMQRLEIGVLLHLIKKHKLWKGRAGTYAEFVKSNKLNNSAARQYVLVAEKFYFELGIRDNRLKVLANCSIGLLCKVSKHANHENIEFILNRINSLSSEDAEIEFESIIKNGTAIESYKPRIISEKYKEIKEQILSLSLEEIVQLRNELYSKTA